jgi:hypothetical protein
MLNFIRNLFKKELPREDVALENLSQWFEEKTKSIISYFHDSAKLKFNEFSILLNTFKKNIEELEKAEIREADRIQNKVKQVVIGNRDNYINKLKQLHSLIKVPNDASYITVVEFCDKVNKELDEFSKNTVKTYYTVQHLFSEPLEQITKSIKRISDLIKEMKALAEEEKILKTIKLKEEIQDFKDVKLKKGQLISRLNETRVKLAKLEKDKIKTQNELENLEKSEEYSSYLQMKQKLDSIEMDISSHKTELIQMFSPLSSTLQKFKRITLENKDLVENYSVAPLDALIMDQDIRIINILAGMEKNILSGSLEIRDKKREKVLEKIKSIEAERLKQIISRHNALNDEKQLLLKRLKVNHIWLKNDEFKYKLEHIENSLNIYRQADREFKAKIDELDLNKLKEPLQNKLKELTDIEVLIT